MQRKKPFDGRLACWEISSKCGLQPSTANASVWVWTTAPVEWMFQPWVTDIPEGKMGYALFKGT